MFNLQQEKIKEKLDAIGFNQLVRRSGFETSYSKKISAFAFLFGFMKMFSYRMHSLSDWAACVGQVSGVPVSKQAIDHKVYCSAIAASLKQILSALLTKQYQHIESSMMGWIFSSVNSR